MRAVLFDEDDAAAVTARLVRDGFQAAARRQPFAGEDDDEDHAWVIETDAPMAVLEPMVAQHDGWLEGDEPPRPAVPLDLPSGPRR